MIHCPKNTVLFADINTNGWAFVQLFIDLLKLSFLKNVVVLFNSIKHLFCLTN